MFANKINIDRCFLCFCKESPERIFHAHSILCPGSEEPLQEFIENLARSSHLELHLPEDTLLCTECCKIIATFIEKKRDLVDRIENAMTYFDQFEITILEEENLCDTETAQINVHAIVSENLIKNKENLEIPKVNVPNFEGNEEDLFIKKRKIKDGHHARKKTQNLLTISEEVEKTYKCDRCHFTHTSETRVLLHKRKHEGLEEKQCPICLKISTRISDCERHIMTVHWKIGYPPAKKKAITKVNPTPHEVIQKEQIPLKLIPEDSVEQMIDDDEHNASGSDNEIIKNEQIPLVVIDEEEKTYKCDLCSFSHYSGCHVVLHRNIHSGLEESQCPFCLKLLSSKRDCIRHMKNHTKFGKYPTNETTTDDESSSDDELSVMELSESEQTS